MTDEQIRKISVSIDVDQIIRILSDYLVVCHPHFMELKKMSLNKFQYFLFSTLLRFSVNIQSLILLFPSFKDDRTFKLPIVLIFRSIISDYLNIQYLLTFYDPSDTNNTAIKNEIVIFDRDFVKFQYDFLFEELNAMKKDGIEPWQFDDKVTERLNRFYFDNQDFYHQGKQGFELKPINWFRTTTTSSFFVDEKERKSAITDRNKYERLKTQGKDIIGIQAFLPYKYFSQFQHPSSNMDQLLMSDPTLVDNRFILMSIDLIFVATNQILIFTFNQTEVEPRIRDLQDELLLLVKK